MNKLDELISKRDKLIAKYNKTKNNKTKYLLYCEINAVNIQIDFYKILKGDENGRH